MSLPPFPLSGGTNAPTPMTLVVAQMFVLVFEGASTIVKAYNNITRAQDDAWWHVQKFAADNGHSLQEVERGVFDNVVLQGFEVCPGHVATIHRIERPYDV